MGELAWGALLWSDTLIVPTWPLILALVGAAGTATAAREGPPVRWWGGLALAPLASWGIAVTLLADHAHRLEALWPQVLVGLISGLAPLVVLALGAGRAHVMRLSASACLALPLALQLMWLGYARFPFVEVDYAPHQHLGRSQTLTAEVSFADCPLRETEMTIDGAEPGEHRVDFEAVCAGFRVRHTVLVTVGAEEADPRFPLSPGRRWRWVLSVEDGATETVEGELTGSRWEDPPLSGIEARFGHRTERLYGFGGHTWVLLRRTGPGPDRHFAPLFAGLGEASPSDVDGLDPAEDGSPFLFVPLRWRCERFITPPGGIEGPDDCLASVDRTDPVLGGLALLLSGGLALPAVMEGASAHAVLASSEATP